MWYRRDDFLNPKKPANFAEPEPGNIGGVEPDPKKLAAEAPGPKVIEIEGTDETDVERDEKAKAGDAVSPVADDDEMYRVNTVNFREDGADTLARVFREPADRGPGVVADEDEGDE